MPPKKSIYRQPGAQHFQLVHRSQRDPLINDPEAGARVFKSISKDQKGKTRAEIAPANEEAVRANEGEATLYGVYFDDTEYDYMQHLRGVGEGEGDGQLLMAPKPKPTAKATKAANQASGFGFTERTQPIDRASSSKFSLPDDVLPSTSELPLAQAYSRLNAALPSELQGLQPDMDPHLRQVLEALEDEAFVDGEEDEDAWLGELVGTGEVDSMMEVEEYEFDEWGINDDELVYPEDEEGYEREEGQSRESEEQGETSWEDRFKAFKKSEDKARAEAAAASDDEDDERGTEGGDTVSGLPTMSVIGAKKRRKGQSDASGYSMSSSSMFRNKGLSTLDEKFDRIERIYEEDSSEDEDPSDAEYDSNGDPIPSSDAPTLVTREDFDSILDDFIDNFEIVGNKLKPVMEGATPMEKLTTMREGMGVGEDAERERKRVLELNRQMEALGWDEEEEDAKLPEQAIAGEHKQGWDAETILSTYSTLENHPRLIDERVRVPRIEIDPKTGFPLVDGQATAKRGKNRRKGRGKPIEVLEQQLEEEEEEGGRLSGGEEEPRRQAAPRPKDETAEEKRARKAAVKEERSNRRVQKKSTKNIFAHERNVQINQHRGKVADGRASDLSVAVDREKVGIVRLV